jgi:hypothetical protein
VSLVKHNNNSISAVTSMASLSTGSMVLISEQTASSSASISFTSGIDSTYPIYKFEFINIHPANNNVKLQFNLSTDGGSNYNVAKTTTAIQSYHYENNVEAILGYDSGDDASQSTGFVSFIGTGIGNSNDENLSATMFLFNPSSSVFVKHFLINGNTTVNSLSYNGFTAGYGNTTSSIDAIKFQLASGNIDSGTIKLYGIKDS